ncbi:hypothetical protein DL96DRAFT_1562001 [Flagelloscypha sp. PMI_526]|nr:hypothetical protein DL96DRAFT_1562001 [Flagelloscypha sp. PMI_526]
MFIRIEPFRFRCLLFGSPSTSYRFAAPGWHALLASKTPDFLAANVKSILILGDSSWDDYGKTASLLSSPSCRGITELAFWISGGELPDLWSFPHLSRLSFNIYHIYSFYRALLMNPSRTLGITHLKLVWAGITRLFIFMAQLPNLSYIQTTWSMGDVGHDALQKLLELPQIVTLILEAKSLKGYDNQWPVLLHTKIVYSDVENWEEEWVAQASGQPDFWEKAVVKGAAVQPQ